jgi:Cof subfamily protein (haloacid dehalogenase superfamily)
MVNVTCDGKDVHARVAIRIVFLDIDGTLVHRGNLVDSARQAVQQLQANGLVVALCTGRSVLHTRAVQDELRINHAVYFNGALARSHDTTILSLPIKPSVVARLVAFTRYEGLPLILHTDRKAVSLTPVPERYHPLLRAYDFPPIEVVEWESWFGEAPNVFQANVMMTPDWDSRVSAAFPECLLYRWDHEAVDLQKGQCDKSIGASALLQHLGLSPEQAVHIGDGGNDVKLFQMVATSVAMGNAAPDVQRQATRTTSAVDEDGVFKACRDLGLI